MNFKLVGVVTLAWLFWRLRRQTKANTQDLERLNERLRWVEGRRFPPGGVLPP